MKSGVCRERGGIWQVVDKKGERRKDKQKQKKEVKMAQRDGDEQALKG